MYPQIQVAYKPSSISLAVLVVSRQVACGLTVRYIPPPEITSMFRSPTNVMLSVTNLRNGKVHRVISSLSLPAATIQTDDVFTASGIVSNWTGSASGTNTTFYWLERD